MTPTKHCINSTLIISVYNQPQYLNLSLQSLERQTVMPNQVIIADDGSNEEVKQVVNCWQKKLEKHCSLLHLWQEDKGFRKAMILNKAFAKSTGDYVITLDGDMIMHQKFIEDHLKFAKKGFFSPGGRVRVKQELTQHFFNIKTYQLSFFTPDIKNRLSALHAPWLTPLFYNRDHFRGCNIAFWRNDLLKVNGYDENYEGWGLEDYDLVVRLLHAGVKKRFIKFAAIGFHLFHIERDLDKTERKRNKVLLDKAKKQGTFWVEKGISQYL